MMQTCRWLSSRKRNMITWQTFASVEFNELHNMHQVEEKYLERLSDITMETYAQVCSPKYYQPWHGNMGLFPSAYLSSLQRCAPCRGPAEVMWLVIYMQNMRYKDKTAWKIISLLWSQKQYLWCSGKPCDPLHQRVPSAGEGKCVEVYQPWQGLREQVRHRKVGNVQFFQGWILGGH